MQLDNAEIEFVESNQEVYDARHLVAACRKAQIKDLGIQLPWDLLKYLGISIATVNIKLLKESKWFQSANVSCRICDLEAELGKIVAREVCDYLNSPAANRDAVIEAASRLAIKGLSDRVAVNTIRHKFLPYDRLCDESNDNYRMLTIFIRANTLIAEEFPDLAVEALAQIKIKRKKLHETP